MAVSQVIIDNKITTYYGMYIREGNASIPLRVIGNNMRKTQKISWFKQKIAKWVTTKLFWSTNEREFLAYHFANHWVEVYCDEAPANRIQYVINVTTMYRYLSVSCCEFGLLRRSNMNVVGLISLHNT